MNRRQFLAAVSAAAGYGASRTAWSLPVSDGIHGDVADAILDRARLSKSLQGYIRYLTLAGLPADYDLPSAYAGLSFWCNSLSTSATIYPPQQVSRTLFAVDLRNYRWSIDAWNLLTKEDGYYYTPGSMILRGDFFCYRTSITTRSNSYYNFLYGVGKNPKTAGEVRDRFRVRLDDAKLFQKLRGIGIKNEESGVVSHNRLIKHAPFVGGDYWQTFDTKTSAGTQNLPNNLDLKHYKPDASELIFNLPNELHAFLLTNGQEKRVEFADPEVVKVPFLYTSKRCVDCHRSQGILPPKEFIPEWVRVAVDLDSKDQKAKDWFEAFYNQDPQGIKIKVARERYQNAVVKCWSIADGDDVAATAETIVSGFLKLVDWYQRPLSLEQACRELGYSAQQVQAALQKTKTSNVSATALGADFVYPRDDWEANGFRQLRSVLKSGGY